MSKLGEDLTGSGKEFQVEGPRTEKARSPYDLVLVLGRERRRAFPDLKVLSGL